MKKLINFLLIITSTLGYLEWGEGTSSFLFEVEADVFAKLFVAPKEVLHPFVMFPLIGQILLAVTLVQKVPSKVLTISGIALIGLLLLFILFVGALSLNWKILLSVTPFIILSVVAIRMK